MWRFWRSKIQTIGAHLPASQQIPLEVVDRCINIIFQKNNRKFSYSTFVSNLWSEPSASTKEMLHGIPTPSGGVKTSRLRVFWSELRVHGDQADHWPRFQKCQPKRLFVTVAKCYRFVKVAGNRFLKNHPKCSMIFNKNRTKKKPYQTKALSLQSLAGHGWSLHWRVSANASSQVWPLKWSCRMWNRKKSLHEMVVIWNNER